MRNNRKDKGNLKKRYLINDQIKASEIRLVIETGENIGVVTRKEALDRAEQTGLDLVKIGDQDSIVIAKLMDFGKHLYLKKKQQAQAKKKQKIIQIKEIKMRPNIGEQDYKVKFDRAVKFLREGKRVKFTLQFRGREMIMMKEIGPRFFEKIHRDLGEKDLGQMVAEKEQRVRPFWSKIYYIKGI